MTLWGGILSKYAKPSFSIEKDIEAGTFMDIYLTEIEGSKDDRVQGDFYEDGRVIVTEKVENGYELIDTFTTYDEFASAYKTYFVEKRTDGVKSKLTSS